MTELLPCPFCGGEAEIREKKVHHSDWFGKDYRLMYRARCKKCGATVGKWEPALLHRDERTSREWGAIAAWNTRAERTCKPVEKDGVMRCQDCDYPLGIMSVPAYCAGCGAKVVGE